MKNLSLLLTLLLFLSITAYSQVTNLKVNGSSSNFTMTSGDQFGWSYDVPNAGDTTLIVIWIDTDQNGILNPSVDVVWTFFNQIDGDPNGQGGPSDIDGVADGHVSFHQNLGLAPAHYIMTFNNHNNTQSVAGIITNLASPTFTISGTVTVPNGFNKANIMLSLESSQNGNGKGFWNALTDANGIFSIQMNSDTSGNPHSLRTNNNTIFGSDIVAPDGYSIVITPGTSAYTGNNFTVTASAASVIGTVRDEYGKPVITEVQVNTGQGNFSRRVPTDQNGVFKVGFLSSALPLTNLFFGSSLTENNQTDTVYVTGLFGIASIQSGDAVNHDITIFKTNSTISGRVTFEGNSPNMNLQLICMNSDTGFVFTYTDINGYYIAHVSNKIYNYRLEPMNGALPPGYAGSSILVHPGQTNANLNITLTGIKSENSNTPKTFNLSQNYPNPFNPSTFITYQIPADAMVTLKIFNLLGNEIKTLENGLTPAGSHQIQFNAQGLSSGVYFYTIQASSLNGKQTFRSTKKMILMK
jgi:Secretion system C-terminal sorting domain